MPTADVAPEELVNYFFHHWKSAIGWVQFYSSSGDNSSDSNKVPGLVKSHSVREEGQKKMQKCPVLGERSVLDK